MCVLMGDKVEPRREFIEKHAHNVEFAVSKSAFLDHHTTSRKTTIL